MDGKKLRGVAVGAGYFSQYHFDAWQRIEQAKITALCDLDAAQARNQLMRYYHHVRKVNGLMVTIWHNHFLGTDPQFAGWRQVYELFLKEEIFWYGS